MSVATVYSRAQQGIQAPLVAVQAHISDGQSKLNIVGLPETIVKESKDRVRSAIMSNGFHFPSQHITINLAPGDLPKQGSRFDLPIALSILLASHQLPTTCVDGYEFGGEVGLDGELHPIKAALGFAIACQQAGNKLFLPQWNEKEASLVRNLQLYVGNDLMSLCSHLCNRQQLPLIKTGVNQINPRQLPDMADVQGQWQARRALEIAASGGHSLLMIGPPGTGKTMLANRLPSLLPELSEVQALEQANIMSLTRQGFNACTWRQVPIRSPHHSASYAALVGGSNPPQPGEISLAHHGVLFLDELPEFKRMSLEALREPLESGHITVSRSNYQTTFPARFQCVAAMNPCPCGYYGDDSRNCSCSAEQIKRYQQRISGPILDRLDMHVQVARLSTQQLLTNKSKGESSQTIRERVIRVRAKQQQRGSLNAHLTGKQLKQFCALSHDQENFLSQAIDKLGLSARAYHRVLRLARTLADMEDKPSLSMEHLQEALAYRLLDRKPAIDRT